MFIFSLITPYEFWDEAMEYPDSDVMLVLRAYWFVVLGVNVIISVLNILSKKYVSIVYLLLTVISVIKVISLLRI